MENTAIWDADDYNKSNGSQYRDAKEMIDQIIKDGANKPDMIVVDIGCGSGNVTKILCKSLSPKKLLASDFDAQMVSYAKNNSSDERIEYFVQDISVPFENLDERLKNLEGKVDLVWSNRVLHWIPEELKERAVKTIARLLKPGGRSYVNLTIQRDLTEFSSDAEKKEIDKYFNFIPSEKQINDWRQYFQNSNLSQVNFEFFEKSWTFETEEQRDQMFSSFEGFLEMFARNDSLAQLAPEERKSIWKKMWEKGVDSVNTAYGKDPSTVQPKTMSDHYEQFRVVGVK